MAIAQETRAGSIAAEQADKATRLAPYEPHWAENLLLSVRQALVEQPAGFYPYFDSVYSGGGLHARRRVPPLHGRSHAVERGRVVFGEGLQTDRGGRHLARSPVRPPRPPRAPRRGGTPRRWRITASGSTAPPTSTRPFACSRPTSGGDVTVRPHRWLLLTAAAAYEDYTLKDPTGSLHPGRGRIHARDRPRRRRESRVPAHDGLCGVRLAASRRLCAARRAVQDRSPSLRRPGQHVQLRPARCRSRAAHSRSCGRTG